MPGFLRASLGASLLLFAAARAAGAQSAPVSDIAYAITFDSATALRRVLHVEMRFATTGDAPVLLSLPAWTPGAYEISNFARWVTGFRAEGDGHALSWDKADPDTWRVRPAGARKITVAFDYLADTLDNAMAWSRPDFALVNGTTVFLYPEGRGLDFPATVRVQAPPDWRVVTAMTSAGAPNTFGASNYHDLVDMPFFIGRVDLDSTRAAGRWVRFASYPAGVMPAADRAHALAEIARIIPVQAAVFGDVPFPSYTVMQIADSAYDMISGLEHQSSHVDVTSAYVLGQPILMSIYAHEIFHAWNVKRLRPADLWPYDYAHPQPTPWLWVSEGITDYYADVSEARAGVIDTATFFQRVAQKMEEVANAPPTALQDASLDTWVHPVDGTENLYYPKGALAGLMLDILVRDASDNAQSLDDVMRRLYRDAYQHGRGFTAEDWWGAVSAAARGRSFADFEAKYVDGREPYPWSAILPLAGLRLRADTTGTPTLGLTMTGDSTVLQVTAVAPGSTAEEAGIRAGDYLLSIGDLPVPSRTFAQRFREKYGDRAGAPVTFRFQRGDRSLVATGHLRVTRRVSITVEPDPAATEKARRIRAGIMHGGG